MCSFNYDFEIIAGTYEEFLLGYFCSVKEKKVKQSFASHDHTGSVRVVAYSDNYLASGGSDDRILIYDLRTRKQSNLLTHHDGTITCLAFTNDQSHLLSGSSDGVFAIVKVGTWQVEKIWSKAHKGMSVLDVAIHPSGKLALTCGADLTLRTWNLVKGREAYTINLKTKCQDAKSLEKIIWCPDETHFILYGGKFVEIWNIEKGEMLKYFEYETKITSCVWLNAQKILTGLENGQIISRDLESDSLVTKQAHDNRIKALSKFKKKIISISSNGEFKVWSEKLGELLKGNTGCRLTCLCVIPMLQIEKKENDD